MIASLFVAGAIVMGSAMGAVADESSEPHTPGSTVTIVVQVPAKAIVPTPDLDLPGVPGSKPAAAQDSALATTGINAQQPLSVLVAGALAVLAGVAIVMRRRRSV